MPMGPDEIIQKEFSRSFFGYDMQEVDSFLDEVIDQFEKLEGERKEMISAMEYLLNKLENAEELPAIKAKYLKGISLGGESKTQQKPKPQAAREAGKRVREQPKQERTTRIKEQVIVKAAQSKPKETVQQPTVTQAKLPPRKVLGSIEKMRTQTMEPVAIEMETMEYAPIPGPEQADNEGAI